MKLNISLNDTLEIDEVISLYKAVGWSSAEKPDLLIQALRNSDALVTARDSGKLVGLGNSISDGYMVVYYPHFVVHPDYQRQGVGRAMMERLQEKYASFHQQMIVADAEAISFYKSLGFYRAGKTEPLWIFDGDEH